MNGVSIDSYKTGKEVRNLIKNAVARPLVMRFRDKTEDDEKVDTFIHSDYSNLKKV